MLSLLFRVICLGSVNSDKIILFINKYVIVKINCD